MCLKNGAPPTGVDLLPEPGAAACASAELRLAWVCSFGEVCGPPSLELIPCRSALPCPTPAPAALPAWLPPWSSLAARNASLYAACPAARATPSYVNATLCLSPNPAAPNASALLGAAIGGGLTGQCAPSCVYSPVPAADAAALAAWFFDADNQCWLQVSQGVAPQACPLGTKADNATLAAATLLQVRAVEGRVAGVASGCLGSRPPADHTPLPSWPAPLMPPLIAEPKNDGRLFVQRHGGRGRPAGQLQRGRERRLGRLLQL